MNFTLATRPPPHTADTPAYWLLFQAQQLLVDDQALPRIPLWTAPPAEITLHTTHYLGTWQGTPCYTAALEASTIAPQGTQFQPLRSLMKIWPEAPFTLAGRASQILLWERNHRFCGHCGTPLQADANERVRRCPGCQLDHYPRITPAVIMRITRGSDILLSRSPHFPPGMRSVQAGFVEAGESLEEAVQREIQEEVGLEICNIRYFGSQPWPFPQSLMLAFTAEYASGDLRVNLDELEAADWYSPKQLPPLPPQRSIAYGMIKQWVDHSLHNNRLVRV